MHSVDIMLENRVTLIDDYNYVLIKMTLTLQKDKGICSTVIAWLISSEVSGKRLDLRLSSAEQCMHPQSSLMFNFCQP